MTIIYREFHYRFDSVDFGIALREYRLERGLTQKEMAQEMGYTSGGIISKLETANYDRELNVRDLITICNFMDVSPAQFFTMEASA